MLRVRTIYASAASSAAEYFAKYLAEAPGEQPGVWSGAQAAGLGLSGTVTVADLELLLSGRDPISGTRLGEELVDRHAKDGNVKQAVAGFEATFSAPKSVSVWWALTGDDRLLEAHDAAVAAVLDHVERFGSTTRARRDGRFTYPDTGGLVLASFRQTTSRSDDPQIHTHAVISSRVRTPDGRWLALDGRYVKRQQRMLGGLYQSVLRSELTARFALAWGPIVKGQAEIAGVPVELIDVFSKRSHQIEAAVKVDEFRQREGRDPSQWERAAMHREAAEDTRPRKSGAVVADLTSRWQTEAASVGWDAPSLVEAIDAAGRDAPQVVDGVTVAELVEAVSATRSSWSRADVLRVLCDVLPTMAEMPGRRWLDVLERAADHTVAQCIDLDPGDPVATRASDGRSLWIHPTATRFTSEAVLVEEEYVLSWAMEAQSPEPAPSTTVDGMGLDLLRADAAAAVAGDDQLVLVVGPAGAGKTRMLARAAVDLDDQGRAVFGLAPTAKAARVLERDTGIAADTVAKLLYEWQRTDRPPDLRYDLPAGTTVVVDEAGAVSTADLSELVGLANWQRWRLVLVGDHRQLQAVGRGGLFAELCATGHVHELEQLHRFTHRWEAVASLQLRADDPRALDAYQDHGRIVAGSLEDHLTRMAIAWVSAYRAGDRVALVASTNDHVDAINRYVQTVRCLLGELDRQHA
ncbi:MAG: MobF family relaxase, partial [Ilumatobacteraceae bacterium]